MERKRRGVEVNILGRKVSLCDALWGARQGIVGDGEAPTATILGKMGWESLYSSPTTSLRSHSSQRTAHCAMRPGLSHRFSPTGGQHVMDSMGSIYRVQLVFQSHRTMTSLKDNAAGQVITLWQSTEADAQTATTEHSCIWGAGMGARRMRTYFKEAL